MTEEMSPFQTNILAMGEKLLEASQLLERWENWANTFGTFIYGQEDFVQLQVDTREFFQVNHTQENL